ncbi:MAG: hypothetical protein U0236_13310 [Nitrospira sp.]
MLSNIISSQQDVHEKFGGVVPELAARAHLGTIDLVVTQALREAQVAKGDLQAVAVTQGPGLAGALLVGVNYAKALSYGLGILSLESTICRVILRPHGWLIRTFPFLYCPGRIGRTYAPLSS